MTTDNFKGKDATLHFSYSLKKGRKKVVQKKVAGVAKRKGAVRSRYTGNRKRQDKTFWYFSSFEKYITLNQYTF